MSEETLASAPSASPATETAGQLLRKAREASGLHVAALAVAMKVPVKKLEALESDRFAELPDAVFVRALAASVCRTLKVDPAPILSKLPQSAAPKFEADDRGINMPFRSPGLFYDNPFMRLLNKPAVLAVMGLLLAALVVAFWPASRSAPTEEAPPVALEKPAVPADAPAPVPVANPQVVTEANPPTAPVLAPVAEAPAKAASAPAAVVPAPVASSAAVAAVNAVMTFKATSTAWVRVTDSKGVLRLEKTLGAGESASAGGDLPLSVVVGNVGATAVEVRGQPYALDAFNKNNVARFEVK